MRKFGRCALTFALVASFCVVAAFASDPTPIPTVAIDYAAVEGAFVNGFNGVIQQAVTMIVAIIASAIGLWGLQWLVRHAPRWFNRIAK